MFLPPTNDVLSPFNGSNLLSYELSYCRVEVRELGGELLFSPFLLSLFEKRRSDVSKKWRPRRLSSLLPNSLSLTRVDRPISNLLLPQDSSFPSSTLFCDNFSLFLPASSVRIKQVGSTDYQSWSPRRIRRPPFRQSSS